MKLHHTLAEAVVQALTIIFVEQKYADKVIEKVLKQNPTWGARDRRFIAETTYDIVRWYRLLKETTDATEHDFWKILGGYFARKRGSVPDWPEFRKFDCKKVFVRLKEAEGVRKVKQSIPDWLDELGEAELGEKWDVELNALNEEAKVVLRVNTLKTGWDELQQVLQRENTVTLTVEGFPDALVLKERQNVFRLDAFKDGLFEVQDAASQLIAPFLKAEPGMRVIDACAGAGGKSLHLAALMKGKGRLIALDTEQWKLDELQKRGRRAGVSNMETRLIDSSKVVKRLERSCDRLLLDVPCSGLGVLKRNPDAKWKLSENFIEDVKALQQKLLCEYSTMVKPGGLMVYATCSILPSENEEQIRMFLQNKGDDFELMEEKRAWPSEGFDGFYMALIKRRGSTST